MSAAGGETCIWCGAEVEPTDGFRAHEPAGARYAVFCRLEHVVPWEIQGAHWEAAPARPEPEHAGAGEPGAALRSGTGNAPGAEVETCAHCEAPLGETAVLLVRHRGEHRIADGFCSPAHMAAWAKAGGRWQQ